MAKFYYFVVLLLLTSETYAFTLNNNISAAFEQDSVQVNFHDGSTCSNTGLGRDALAELIPEAVNNFWNKIPSSRLRLRYGSIVSYNALFNTGELCRNFLTSTCPAGSVPTVPNDIVIACNNNTNNFTSTRILAVTLPNNLEGKAIKGAVILINDIAGSQVAALSRNELISVISHEIGHAIGLGHSPVSESLMYYSTVSFRSHLGRDDIDGVTFLYPKREKLLGILGCGSTQFTNGGDAPPPANNSGDSSAQLASPVKYFPPLSAFLTCLLFGLFASFVILSPAKIFAYFLNRGPVTFFSPLKKNVQRI